MSYPVQTHQAILIAYTYNKIKPQLLSYLRLHLDNDDTAEDLIQDTFLRILQMDNLITPLLIHPLVFRVARNLLYDYLRRQMRTHEMYNQLYLESPCSRTSVEEEVEANELAKIEHSIVSLLPVQRRKVYELSRYYELTTEEIGKKLGMSKRTADTHLFLGRKIVRLIIHANGF